MVTLYKLAKEHLGETEFCLPSRSTFGKVSLKKKNSFIAHT